MQHQWTGQASDQVWRQRLHQVKELPRRATFFDQGQAGVEFRAGARVSVGCSAGGPQAAVRVDGREASTGGLYRGFLPGSFFAVPVSWRRSTVQPGFKQD